MTETSAPPASTEPIIARAGSYYRNTRYLMTVLLVGMGLWFGYDGFVSWPQSNVYHEQLEKERLSFKSRHDEASAQDRLEKEEQYKFHSPTDILMQKILCFSLPPLGIILLIRALHNSRGEYRLENNTLAVPGHPTIDLSNITEVDRRLRDRKGLAFILYEKDGRQGRIRLDDFVYDRPPTDLIFQRIEQFVTPATQQTTRDETAGGTVSLSSAMNV